MNKPSGAMEAISPTHLFRGYTPPAEAYDELMTESGRVRPAWERLIQGLEALGPQNLAQRWEQARHLLRENGVTYNVYAAPQGPNRPWELDPVPLVLDRREWQTLAAGIEQRARLLNQLVADLYGPQRLIREQIIPARLLYAHPGFLRSCHGAAVAQNIWVHLYASHLARTQDGRWVVLADRTQGPSGAGYAVENRIVISRTLPADFHSLHVERLAPFFIRFRESLISLAQTHRDNPQVVLLSPGHRSATYFEDSYLSRYLGYTLVEGGDLTVRGAKVFLKTLGGLVPVDVILRRGPDEECDPLELRGDSTLGVPGLVQAVREKQVVVANALGSGLVEAPAFMAFLPTICRELLNEPLKLPSVPTWWCGRAEDLQYVADHLEELVIKPAYLYRSEKPILVSQLTKGEQLELLARIRNQPESFVAQDVVTRSTAPVWAQGSFQPWRVGLRLFAAAASGGYTVMPGGLSRVFSGPDGFGESVSAGQGSKDVWVLSDRPVESVTLLKPAGSALEVRRSPYDLPSRVAENLFWLGRHVERADAMVRHLRSTVVRMTADMDPGGWNELTVLVAALYGPDETRFEIGEDSRDDLLDELRREIIDFVFREDRADAFYQTLRSLHASASHVRDRISVDSWRIINQLDLASLMPSTGSGRSLGDLMLLFNKILNLLSAFGGLATESMTRGLSWRFLDMGRRVERASMTLQLVGRVLTRETTGLSPLLEAVLEIADSTMTYRYRYLTSLQIAPVLDLLLIDETNPRAVGYQLAALAEHVKGLPSEKDGPMRTPEQRIVLAAQSMLRLTDVDALGSVDAKGTRADLTSFLEQLLHHLRQLSDALTNTYLVHTAPSQPLGR
jgi:uncharacterized circularly permuted ATP-grasp superfamily protein/uncharacterized alpha-E superfamily protein